MKLKMKMIINSIKIVFIKFIEKNFLIKVRVLCKLLLLCVVMVEEEMKNGCVNFICFMWLLVIVSGLIVILSFLVFN